MQEPEQLCAVHKLASTTGAASGGGGCCAASTAGRESVGRPPISDSGTGRICQGRWIKTGRRYRRGRGVRTASSHFIRYHSPLKRAHHRRAKGRFRCYAGIFFLPIALDIPTLGALRAVALVMLDDSKPAEGGHVWPGHSRNSALCPLLPRRAVCLRGPSRPVMVGRLGMGDRRAGTFGGNRNIRAGEGQSLGFTVVGNFGKGRDILAGHRARRFLGACRRGGDHRYRRGYKKLRFDVHTRFHCEMTHGF